MYVLFEYFCKLLWFASIVYAWLDLMAFTHKTVEHILLSMDSFTNWLIFDSSPNAKSSPVYFHCGLFYRSVWCSQVLGWSSKCFNWPEHKVNWLGMTTQLNNDISIDLVTFCGFCSAIEPQLGPQIMTMLIFLTRVIPPTTPTSTPIKVPVALMNITI